MVSRWNHRRGALLLLAENEVARRALSSGVVGRSDSLFFAELGRAIAPGIIRFAYTDAAGRTLYTWTLPDSADAGIDRRAGAAQRTMALAYPVVERRVNVGSVDALVDIATLLPPDSTRLLMPEGRLAIRGRATGTLIRGLTPSAVFPTTRILTIDAARWIAHADSVSDVPFDLAVAAPVAAYVEPFERDGRTGFAALAAVTLIALLLSALLTSRLARFVGGIADAADAVAGGDLAKVSTPAGPAELQRLSRSFNTMTESLRRMVAELSQRRALAAVGDFAASLSHEVRNALTSVQVDLERVEERSEDRRNRALVQRTLTHVRRLDAVVTGALRVARSGTVAPGPVSLGDVLRDAMVLAQPSFDAGGARLIGPPLAAAPTIAGDRDALRQLFLNVLLNALQALPTGGEATISVRRVDRLATVTITDTGHGMSPEQIARAFEPYYSTRPEGTGLGLPIARQIAIAHGGTLNIQSSVGHGTTVEVVLPIGVPVVPPIIAEQSRVHRGSSA
jgi:signal transduction histidine kinase